MENNEKEKENIIIINVTGDDKAEKSTFIKSLEPEDKQFEDTFASEIKVNNYKVRLIEIDKYKLFGDENSKGKGDG